jgi:hypothetical protein
MDATNESPNNTSTEKQSAKSVDDHYFLINAISCWLYHFPEHKWTPIYRELAKRKSFNTEEQKVVTPRRARRRKPKV